MNNYGLPRGTKFNTNKCILEMSNYKDSYCVGFLFTAHYNEMQNKEQEQKNFHNNVCVNLLLLTNF